MDTLKGLIEEALEHPELVTWLLAALTAAATFIAGKLGWSIPKGWAWERVQRAFEAVRLAVKYVNQTHVDALKRAREMTSPGGAMLTDDEKNAAKQLAWAKLHELIGSKALLNVALWIVGVRGGVDPWLDAQLEAAVHDTKIGGPVAAPVSAPPVSTVAAAGASPSR